MEESHNVCTRIIQLPLIWMVFREFVSAWAWIYMTISLTGGILTNTEISLICCMSQIDIAEVFSNQDI